MLDILVQELHVHAKISCGPKFLGVSPGHRMNLVSSMLRKSFLNVCTCLIMCGLSSVLAFVLITQVSWFQMPNALHQGS